MALRRNIAGVPCGCRSIGDVNPLQALLVQTPQSSDVITPISQAIAVQGTPEPTPNTVTVPGAASVLGSPGGFVVALGLAAGALYLAGTMKTKRQVTGIGKKHKGNKHKGEKKKKGSVVPWLLAGGALLLLANNQSAPVTAITPTVDNTPVSSVPVTPSTGATIIRLSQNPTYLTAVNLTPANKTPLL